jgi:hypothetical protein
MAERHNTLVCTFDPTSPRITAHDIHEWIYEALRIPEGDVHMIQIDGIRRQVFIKLTNSDKVAAVLRDKGEQVEYKYPTGEVSFVSLAMAGMGTKRVRVANLPPEVPDETLRASFAPYGKVLDIQVEKWSKAYRYAVANGIRQVTLLLTKHAPSHLTVAGHRVLLAYEGQPATCYGCGEVGHTFQGCPGRQGSKLVRPRPAQASYASVVSTTAGPPEQQTPDVQAMDEHQVKQVSADTSLTAINVPPSEAGTLSDDNGAPKQTALPAPSTDDHEQHQHHIDAPDREVVECETDNAETNIPHTDLPTGRGEESRHQPMFTNPQTYAHDTEDQSAKRECEDHRANIAEANLKTSINDKPTEDVGSSPKRSKKMKVDKTGENPRERSRSMPRRTSHKGKM